MMLVLPTEAARMPVVSDSYCIITNSPRVLAVITDRCSFLMHLLILAGLFWGGSRLHVGLGLSCPCLILPACV